MCKISHKSKIQEMIVRYSIPSSFLKKYWFPFNIESIRGLPPSTQYTYFSLWTFWNELQAEIQRAILNRAKDISRKSKSGKIPFTVFKEMTTQTQVEAILENGKKTIVYLYLSPRTLEIIPKTLTNENPYWFSIKDEDFCSLFHISRRTLTGKNGARELLREKNLIEHRIKWKGRKKTEYKLLDPLEKAIEFIKEPIRELFYKREISFTSKVLFFWFKKYVLTKAFSKAFDIDDINLKELKNFCGFDIETIKKAIDKIEDLILF